MANTEEQTSEPTETQAAAIDANQLAQLVNSAVNAQLKRSLPKALEGIIPTLIEKMKPEPSAEPEPKAGPSPEVAAMQKQMAAMKDALDQERLGRLTAERNRREEQTYGVLRQALSDAKIKPETIPFVEAYLARTGAIVIDDEGHATMKVSAPLGKGLPDQEQELPIGEAVKLFAKTKAAEPFLPPPGGPAGAGGGQRSGVHPALALPTDRVPTEAEMLAVAAQQIEAYHAKMDR